MTNEYSSKADEILDNFFLDIKAAPTEIMEVGAHEQALKQLTDLHEKEVMKRMKALTEQFNFDAKMNQSTLKKEQ